MSGFTGEAGDRQHRRDDLEREPGRDLERVQIQQQRPGLVAGVLRDAGAENVGARQRLLMGTRLAQQAARPLGIALHEGLLGQLAQVMRRDAATLAAAPAGGSSWNTFSALAQSPCAS